MSADNAVPMPAFFNTRSLCATSVGELKSLVDFSDACLEIMKERAPKAIGA